MTGPDYKLGPEPPVPEKKEPHIIGVMLVVLPCALAYVLVVVSLWRGIQYVWQL